MDFNQAPARVAVRFGILQQNSHPPGHHGTLAVPPIVDTDDRIACPALATETGFLAPFDPGQIVLLGPEALIQLLRSEVDAFLLPLVRRLLQFFHAEDPGRVSQSSDRIGSAPPFLEPGSLYLDRAKPIDLTGIQPRPRRRQLLDERSVRRKQ